MSIVRVVFRAPVLAAAILCTSCFSSHRIAVADIDPQAWTDRELFEASYLNGDSLGMYNMTVLVRYDNLVSTDILQMIVSCSTPDSLFFEEEVSVPMPKHEHQRNTEYNEAESPYRYNVRLSRTGEYKFTFSTPELSPVVRGVSAVGIVFTPVSSRHYGQR